MNTVSRQEYLKRLGLTAWQQREAAPESVVARAETTERTNARPDAARDELPPSTLKPSLLKGESLAPDASLSAASLPVEDAASGLPEPTEATDAKPPSAATELATMNWDELEAWLGRQDHRGASRPVFGTGVRTARLLVIGEAPGQEEDRRGEPFVGRAGQLLDRMLAAIGHSRTSNTYIANICKFRPENNRDPNAAEIAADWPVLERQIALLQPRIILAVGRVAAQTLLDSKAPLGKLRQQMHQFPGSDIPLLITYHPAYLLRSPADKAKAWVDLKQLSRQLRKVAA